MIAQSNLPGTKLAYRIEEVCKATGLGRTSIYAAIKAGSLVARKYGRATIILRDDLVKFMQQLPTACNFEVVDE